MAGMDNVTENVFALAFSFTLSMFSYGTKDMILERIHCLVHHQDGLPSYLGLPCICFCFPFYVI